MAGARDLTNNTVINTTVPYWWHVNIGSINELVQSGDKPLPVLKLAQVYFASWRH